MFHGWSKVSGTEVVLCTKKEQKQTETHKSEDTNFIQTCIIILPQK